MPELPEVETTRRQIAPVFVGRRIRELRTTVDSYFFITDTKTLGAALRGRRIARLERVGKYLVAGLDDDARLLLHLGMTGQLFSSRAMSPRLLSATARAALAPEAQVNFEPDAHTHLHFLFDDDGPDVYMRDVRKFGKVLWLAPDQSDARLDRLGIDALEVDGRLLFAAGRKKKAAIKALLLDQSVIAGCGNIYADEALFHAGVRPGRAAGRVTASECDRIAEALVRVLQRAIETGGSSISDYVSPEGRDGSYQDERRVYARAGLPCLACGAAIRRKVVAQRGTHYCPRCQK
jgi:formamidopyrimidine-DNA glycosylase